MSVVPEPESSPAASAPSPTPWGTIRIEEPEAEMAQRILDAAFTCFASHGIAATTMSQLAEEAGISRVWLYRFFENRDAVIRGLLGREAHRFLVSLAARFDLSASLSVAVVEAFLFAIETLRGHELLQKVLRDEPEFAAPFLTTNSGPLLRIAGDAMATLVAPMGAMEIDDARLVIETLLRLALSIVVNNDAMVDFDDPVARRAYAEVIIPRLVVPELP